MNEDTTSQSDNETLLLGSERAQELAPKPLQPTQSNTHLPQSGNVVRIWRGQPVIIDNYPPLCIGGEIVTNHVDSGRATAGTIRLKSIDEQDLELDEPFFGEWMKGEPFFPTKPDERFATCHAHEVTIPFQQPQSSRAEDPTNIIHESERCEAIATVLARIVIRVQQREENNETI